MLSMSDDRRSHRRRKCQWIGLVTLESGPRLPVMVRDLSPIGAKLTLAGGGALTERTDLALTTYRRGWWRMGRRRAVQSTGRVTRVQSGPDGALEAAVQFHTPTVIR